MRVVSKRLIVVEVLLITIIAAFVGLKLLITLRILVPILVVRFVANTLLKWIVVVVEAVLIILVTCLVVVVYTLLLIVKA